MEDGCADGVCVKLFSIPENMWQHVYSPHGHTRLAGLCRINLSSAIAPTVTRLQAASGKEDKNVSDLIKLEFQKLDSARSIMQIPATPMSALVMTVSKTDDMLFSCKFGYSMKETVKAGVRGFYDITT